MYRGAPCLLRFSDSRGGPRTVIELDSVMRSVTDDDVVMIDDARLFRGYSDCGGDYRSECYPCVAQRE